MNKVAVLGSSGQVGAYMVGYLQRSGYSVDGYDIEPHPVDGITNIICDLRCDNLDFSGYDSVYFMAFDVGGSRYLKKYQDTSDFIGNNMSLMANVFGALRKSDTPFIFTSSQMANMSYSPYGLLKHIGELYTKSLGGLVVKFWNVYGIEHDHEKSHVITDFILKGKEGIIDMMTDGTEVRQFLYAEDCCECLETLLRKYNEISRDQELHITNFEWNSILDIAKYVTNHFPGCEVQPSLFKDTVQKDARNEPDPYIKTFWQPKTTLQEGISKIIHDMELH